jgi:hypothetical protein
MGHLFSDEQDRLADAMGQAYASVSHRNAMKEEG